MFCSFVLLIAVINANPIVYADDGPPAGVYEVVKSDSELRMLVYRGGIFSRFGHNHVISTRNIDGQIDVGENPMTVEVRLAIPVSSFEVDLDALREEEGEAFKKTVSEKDKRGTRNNMLGKKLLDAANFDKIIVHAQDWSGDLPDIKVIGEFTVRDQTHRIGFPASVVAGDEQIIVSGGLAVTHDQLGLVPFKRVLGGLRVRDGFEMKFRIAARRIRD